MSVVAGLIRYPAEVYNEVKAEGTYYPPNGRHIQQCHLSHSCDELHPALRSFGVPLCFALSGDYGFNGGLDRFGWDEENDSDHYVGFVSPTFVGEFADRLRGLTFERLAAKLAEPSRGFEYLAPRFRELVEFYAAAAHGGDCVFVHVA